MKRYYRSCRDLPLYNFFEIIETGNVNWLVVGYDGEDRKAEDELMVLWQNIFDEYITLKGDENVKDYYRTVADVAHLENKLRTVAQFAELYELANGKEIKERVLQVIANMGVVINPKKDIGEQLLREVKGIRTNINRIKLKNPKVFTKKKKKKTQHNFERDVANIEFILDKSNIDTKKISVARWIAYLEQADRKIKAKKAHGKGKVNI